MIRRILKTVLSPSGSAIHTDPKGTCPMVTITLTFSEAHADVICNAVGKVVSEGTLLPQQGHMGKGKEPSERIGSNEGADESEVHPQPVKNSPPSPGKPK